MYRMIGNVACGVLIVFSGSIFADQNPMRPPSWAKKPAASNVVIEKINLQQILISENRKLAVINNKVLQEGQVVAGVTVVEIKIGQVRIRRGGVSEIIKLLPPTKEVIDAL